MEKPRKSKAPSNEKLKSPEQLRFEELTADYKKRVQSSHYFSLGLLEEQTPKNWEKDLLESVLVTYGESGDPEKIALYKLIEARNKVDSLATAFYILRLMDKPQRKGMERNGDEFTKKKHWQGVIDKNAAELQPMLSELGLAMPQTKEEADALRRSIITLENWQKLAENYKKK